MNNLKRVLGLGLASVMLIGTMATGALAVDAKDFTDTDEILNQEAVATMVSLSVINGKEDGSYYDPAGTVTRAEMAKMITIMLNGGKEPVLGVKGTPTYTDIAGHWAEKYIEYCSSNGIIAGQGDGTFNPDGSVTGSQAAKMALTALGYDAGIFHFTGADWEINTNSYANAPDADLYDELETLDPTQPINRDNAAQLLYNALDAKVMTPEYDKVISNGEVSWNYKLSSDSFMEKKFGAVKVEGIVTGNEVANLASATGAHLDANRTRILVTNYGDGKDEQDDFGNTSKTESVTIQATTGLEELGRSVNVYIKKDSSKSKAEIMGNVIVSADNVVVTDYSGDPIADVADDNGLSLASATDTTVTGKNKTQVYQNYQGGADYAATINDDNGANINGIRGYEKILIDCDDDGTIDFVLINTYRFGKVTSYVTSGDGSITVNVGTTSLSKDDADDVVGFEDVAKNDYVLAAMIGDRLHVSKAETATEELASYKEGSSGRYSDALNHTTKLEAGDTNYNVSWVAGYTGGTDNIQAAMGYGANNLDNEATFYLGKGGYVVAVGEVVDNAYKYCLILAGDINSVTDQVRVALSDGTKATYTVNTNGATYSNTASGNGKFTNGDVCAYTISSNGQIKLEEPTQPTPVTNANFTKNKTALGSNLYANANTAFFYVNSGTAMSAGTAIASKDVDIYTGYSSAPSVDGSAGGGNNAKFYTNAAGRVVAVVYQGASLSSADMDDLIYIYDKGNSNSDYTKIDAFLADSSDRQEGLNLDIGSSAAEGIYKYTINSDGYYETETITTFSGGTGNLLKSTFNGTSGTTYGVYSATSKTIVIGEWNAATQDFSAGTLYEVKITSDTLLIDDSDDLDDPVAELGAGPEELDRIAYIVFDLDSTSPDEAKMIVIKRDQKVDSNATGISTAANAQSALNSNLVSSVTMSAGIADTDTINVPAGKTLVLNGATNDLKNVSGKGIVEVPAGAKVSAADYYDAAGVQKVGTVTATSAQTVETKRADLKLKGEGTVDAFDPNKSLKDYADISGSSTIGMYRITLDGLTTSNTTKIVGYRQVGGNWVGMVGKLDPTGSGMDSTNWDPDFLLFEGEKVTAVKFNVTPSAGAAAAYDIIVNIKD